MSFTYQWLRCNAAGGSCVDIPGETGTTYTLGAPDVGGTIRVRVSDGTRTATSGPTAIIGTGTPPPALGALLPARIPESAGAVLYVGGPGASDANPGTSGSPWATPQHAVDTLASDQKALIRTGTYPGVKVYHKANAAPVTLEADAGAHVIFRGHQSGSNSPLDIWDSENWRFRNIEVDGALSQVCCAFNGDTGDVNGHCRKIELFGINAHDAQKVLPGTPVGLFLSGTALTEIQVWNSRFWRVGRRANTASAIVAGASTILVDSTAGIPGSGQVWLPDKTRASYTGTSGGNTLTGVTGVASSWPAGTVLFGVSAGQPWSLDHGGYYAKTAGLNNPDVLIANDLFYDNLAFGMQFYPAPRNIWCVNTVSAYNFNYAGFVFTENATNDLTGCKAINCIAYANDPLGHDTFAGGFNWTVGAFTSSPINEVSHSIAYLNKGSVLAALNIDPANGRVAVAANQVVDPLFVDAANGPTHRDFHLQAGSPAFGAGDPAYCPAFDFDGNARSSADIGAFAT